MQIVQHATVVQDNKCLIEPVIERVRSSQYFSAPLANGLSDLLPQYLNGYWIHQHYWTLSGQGNSLLPHHLMIKIAAHKRTLRAGSDETFAQDCLYASDQLLQNGIKFRIRCWGHCAVFLSVRSEASLLGRIGITRYTGFR